MTTRVGEQKYGRNIRDGILRRNAGEFLEVFPQIRLLPRVTDLSDMGLGGNDTQGFWITISFEMVSM